MRHEQKVKWLLEIAGRLRSSISSIETEELRYRENVYGYVTDLECCAQELRLVKEFLKEEILTEDPSWSGALPNKGISRKTKKSSSRYVSMKASWLHARGRKTHKIVATLQDLQGRFNQNPFGYTANLRRAIGDLLLIEEFLEKERAREIMSWTSRPCRVNVITTATHLNVV